MKFRSYISVLAVAAVLLASCVQLQPAVEEQQVEPEQKSLIGFGTQVTKGLVTDDSELGDISVFSRAANGSTSFIPFNNTKIFAASDWSYVEPKYWAYSFSYSFYLMHPYKESFYTFTHGDEVVDYTADDVKFNVTTGYGASLEQVDYMAGFHHRDNVQKGESGTRTVAPTMKHLCASVSFIVENESGLEYTISNVSLTGLKYKGQCKVTSDGSAMSFGWTLGPETAAGAEFKDAAASYTVADEHTQVLFGGEPIIVLPQTIKDDVAGIDVKFNITTKVGTEDAKTRSLSLSDAEIISGADPKEWVAGNHYVYTASLRSGKLIIKFIKVMPWEHRDVGTIKYKGGYKTL